MAPHRDIAASRSRRENARGVPPVPPDADEVINRFLRGYVLFGRPGARLAKFEWESFATRAIGTGENSKIPTRLRGVRRNSDLEVRFDEDFEEIAKACQEERSGWIWLTDELIDVYGRLNVQGLAGAIGTYRDGRLVGGIWGITIGRTFSIMSIFHRENHAGSIAMAALVDIVIADGRWTLIDFGSMKPHFARFGAVEVSEERFLKLLQENCGPGAGNANLPGRQPRNRRVDVTWPSAAMVLSA